MSLICHQILGSSLFLPVIVEIWNHPHDIDTGWGNVPAAGVSDRLLLGHLPGARGPALRRK